MSEVIKDYNTQTDIKVSPSSYRSIFKATSLFGGVQVIQILVNIVKSKFIAILLGPEGVGIQGLYQSAIQMIQSFTSLGLSQSAVRDVSEANATGDIKKVNRTITILQKLVWITGMFGTITVCILSPALSKTTFGNYDYTIPLIFLSITLLLDQLCAGQRVILQGMRRLKDLAKASTYGAFWGLIVCIPLYYLLGIRGIVPTLILNSVIALLLSWYYSKKNKKEKVQITTQEVFHDGRLMLKMGIAMSISNIMLVVTAYILRSFIRMESGADAVGVFTAGYAIINSYVGMFFSAMSTDFYPRLAAVNNDNDMCRIIVNQQGEIGSLIMGPMLIACIVFMPFAIVLLYSRDFLGAYDYILFAAIGMMFRFFSVLVAHLFVAKGSSKLYILNETIVSIYTLVLNLIGYKSFGMMGLGLSFTLSYFIYMIQVIWLTNKHYEYKTSKDFLTVFSVQIFLIVIVFFTFLFSSGIFKYSIGTIGILLSGLLSIIGLEKRLNLVRALKKYCSI